MSFIDWLHHGRLNRERAGGKGASLSELAAAGFSVPAGFCIIAEGYRRFAEKAGLTGRIGASLASIDLNDRSAIRNLADMAATLIGEAPLPDDLRLEISAAYDELATSQEAAYAVRSSALAEDGANASFAGLYESYLNVGGLPDVLDCVRRCYASMWSERAIRYRSSQRGSGEREAMAVVVMGLVACETSGVAFTAHPVTGARDVVVMNAAFGLGEAIVSGAVTPDSFVVGKTDLVIREREIFDKEIAVYPHPGGAGTVEVALQGDAVSAPSLTEEQACEVARLAMRIEAHYGSPQDVEWGLVGGRIFVFQSRPITTLR
jgi:pyruvate,water dikinase